MEAKIESIQAAFGPDARFTVETSTGNPHPEEPAYAALDEDPPASLWSIPLEEIRGTPASALHD